MPIHMIITCPSCSTSFRLDPAQLGTEGRKVRCTSCSHVWIQHPPQAVPEDMGPLLAGESRPRHPRPESSSAPRSRSRRLLLAAGWLLLVVAVLGVAGAGIFARDRVVALWPATARLYTLVGMAGEPPGTGFELRDVRSKREDKDGVPLLVINGEIVNISDRIRPLPGLRATLRDAEGYPIRQWQVTLAEARLLPGESTPFESSVRNPPEEATRLSINFAARP